VARIAGVAALAVLLSFGPALGAEKKITQAGAWEDRQEFLGKVRRMARGAPPEDHYTLKVSLHRDSAWDRETFWPGSHDSMHEKTRWGPMDIAVKLVPRRHFFENYPLRKVRELLAYYILRRAIEWRVLDSEKKYIEKLDDMEKGTRGYENFKALADAMPDLERRMKAIDTYAEDAQRILRLLQGIGFYKYGPRPDKVKGRKRKTFQGRDLPISGPVQARFSGAQWQGRKRGIIFDPFTAGWWSAEAKAKSWSADDVQRERDWRPFVEQSVGMPYAVRARVWRFKLEDMARVRALIADFDAVKKALHEDGYSGAPTTPDGHRHARFNSAFWEPFLDGLRHVVTFAWIMSPHRPPENMFTDDRKLAVPGSIRDVGDWILKPDAPLVLPPIAGDTLMQLQVPHRVFASPPPDEVSGAKRIIEAMGDGTGAVMLDGKMQDDASVKQCKVMVAYAKMIAERDPEYAELYGFPPAQTPSR